MEQDILNDYQQRVQSAQLKTDKYEKLANKYSLQRLIVFGAFIFSIYLSVVTDDIVIFVFGLVISVIGFSWLVSQQNKYDDLKKYHSDLKKVNENEITNITTHGNIYNNGTVFVNEKHFYTADLDIFGLGSLFQFINRSATTPGIYKLAAWLNAPSDKQTILARQEAVKELTAKAEWKLNFQTRLLFAIKQPSKQIKNLLTYLKIPVEIKNERLLWVYSFIAPFLLLSLLILSIFYPAAKYFSGVVIFANYRIAVSHNKTVKIADMIAGKIGASLSLYAQAFECIEQEEWQSDCCKQAAAHIIHADKQAVSLKIKELSRLIGKLDNRLNFVVGFLLNIFFIWDVRQIIAIERWKQNNHENFGTAFNAIAEFEALISLSSLAINYPNWQFPHIADGDGYTISSKNIAHPLIIKNSVANDYELYDTFKIDIITGSNMAGKSTFLRTVGINTVLALSGAPVCAGSMTVSVITMVTYMRIKDSLNESTSTFKAELDRLQMLLAAVENVPKVFFLIDEMLRGTNSVDKYLGSKAVIEQLISKKGVGMVATHDLQIAHLEQKYPDYVRNFYFDIQVLKGEMLFDYKMKHGECKTFNASLLLKQIGIDVDAE